MLIVGDYGIDEAAKTYLNCFAAAGTAMSYECMHYDKVGHLYKAESDLQDLYRKLCLIRALVRWISTSVGVVLKNQIAT